MARGSLISRCTAVGVVAVLLSMVLWPFIAGHDWALWPFMALIALAALAGVAVLLLTGIDLLLHPRRGERVGPIRVFDVVCGGALLGFALLQLRWLGGWVP